MVSLSVIVPTVGRHTLHGTIDSVIPDLQPGDELLVIGDGVQPIARRAAENARALTSGGVLYGEIANPVSVYGNAQRDLGVTIADNSHLCFIDDDDRYMPGALNVIRDRVGEAPDAAHVFRAEWGSGHHAAGTVLWETPELRTGNVGTPMVVLPRNAGLPRWMAFNDRGTVSDYGWISAAVAGLELVWHEEIVARVRPYPNHDPANPYKAAA